MTVKDRIIQQLKAGVPLTDAQLKSRLKTTHQTINQACRQLEALGILSRSEGSDGYIENRLIEGSVTAMDTSQALGLGGDRLDSNVARGSAFQDLSASVLGAHFGCQFLLEVPIAIGEPAKNHRFDLVSNDGRRVGECKSFTWTGTGNMPGAKITTVNEAVFYLSFLPEDVYRFVVMRRDLRFGHGESLASYYWRTNRHLLRGVSILELHEETGSVADVGQWMSP